MSLTALADGVNYISRIHVAYEHIDYKAGEAPRTAASVTDSDSHCTVASEHWREIYQPDSDCAGRIDITEEGWEAGRVLNDVIKSTDATPRVPIAGGEAVPVAFWYSDESRNNALAQDKRITAFEEGKSYMYSISLKGKDGYVFAVKTSSRPILY